MINSHLGSFPFLQYMSAYGITSKVPLLRLASQLQQWNIERTSSKEANQQLHDLCIEDIDFLRRVIQSAVVKAAVKCPDVFLDQILFLVIGAIQIEHQTGSDKAWKQVHQAILSYLNAKKEKQVFRFSLATMTFLVGLSALTFMNYKVPGNYHISQDSPLEYTSSGRTDPVTMSTLLLAYQKVTSGTCRVPQLESLPPEQREAYLMFADKGFIDVHNVQDLQLALDYVNCLYPHVLMHPLSSFGNRL